MLLDTTSINYAIGKFSEACTKIAPTIQNVSAKMVQYYVLRQCVLTALFLIILTMGVCAFIIGFKQCQNHNWEDGPHCIPIIMGAIAGLVGLVGFLWAGCGMTMALMCPEIFTLQAIIKTAQ